MRKACGGTREGETRGHIREDAETVDPSIAWLSGSLQDVLKNHVNGESRWLDLGSGHQLLPEWREEEEKHLIRKCRSIVGIGRDLSSLRAHKHIDMKVGGDITRLPFREACFTLVIANMVVEHLDHPAAQFREINRILRPGGLLIFHTPNALGCFSLLRRMIPENINQYLVRLPDGRASAGVFKVYYRANTRRVISRLAESLGFEVVRIQMVVSDAVFELVPPLALCELLWIRALMTDALKPVRTNIISVLRKRVVPLGSADDHVEAVNVAGSGPSRREPDGTL